MTVKNQNHEIINYFSDSVFFSSIISEIYCGGICTPLARIFLSLRECSGIKCSGISITWRWPGDRSCCIFITAFWTVLWILSTLWKEFPSFFTQNSFWETKDMMICFNTSVYLCSRWSAIVFIISGSLIGLSRAFPRARHSLAAALWMWSRTFALCSLSFIRTSFKSFGWKIFSTAQRWNRSLFLKTIPLTSSV